MSLHSRLVVPAVFLMLSFLIGCGGSGSNKATPPPTGGFTNSNLTGTYVFSTSGYDVNNSPIMLAGTFTASGSGNISGGTFTFSDGTIGTGTNQAITGGAYSITQDGRGQVRLANSSSLGTITLDVVLTSSNHGFAAEYDANGSGSGTLDTQTTVAQSDVDGKSYAFGLSGNGSSGLIASVGAFTLDTNGAVTTGLQDVTSYSTTTGGSASQTQLAIGTSSSVAVGTGTAPGKVQISSSAGLFTFDAYAIDATHLKLVETDGLDIMSGDLFSQTSSLPTGNVVFTMGGADVAIAPLGVGGILPVSSGVISGGTEDYDDAGAINTVTTVSGGFSALSGGRSVLTLSNFVNGALNQVPGNYSFAAYPSSGGTLLLEVDNGGITEGTALAQSSTTFNPAAGFAVSISAANTASESDIAEFTTTSSGFSGLIDINDQGSTSFDQKFSGTYATASTGRYTFSGAVNGNSNNSINGVFYTVDATTALFLETDTTQVGTGIFALQSTPAASAAKAARSIAQPHFSLGRSLKMIRK